MHRCPQCDYAFGPLPGTPKEPLGEFSEDVRCPECSRVIPRGSRIVVGSSVEEAMQPITDWRRRYLVLAALGPGVYLAFHGAQGVLAMFGAGPSGGFGGDLFRSLALLAAAWLIINAWRRWNARDDGDRRIPASWELQWLVSPGIVTVFDRTGKLTLAGRGSEEATDNALVTEVRAALVQDIRATAPNRSRYRKRLGRRNIAMFTLSEWKFDLAGNRSGVESRSIYADVGGPASGGAVDHEEAVLAAGGRAAASLRATVGTVAVADAPPGAPVAPAPSADPDLLALRGPTHAMLPWPQPRSRIARQLMVPASLGGVMAAIAIGLALTGRSSDAEAAFLRGVAWVGGTLFAVTVAFGIFRARRALKRSLARSSWAVRPDGVEIIEEAYRSVRQAPEVRSTRYPRAAIGGVAIGEAFGMPLLTLNAVDGRALATISPEAMDPPDGTAFARRVNGVLGIRRD